MNFLLIFIIFLLAAALLILAIFALARNETEKEGRVEQVGDTG